MSYDPLIGKTLANFRIDRPIGQGGMAVVYLGEDIQLDRPVAIKLINAQFQGNPEYAARFVSEAKLVARWRHENIISVYYADQQDDLYYFVMEYIDGATLSDLLKRYISDDELMPHDDVIRIARAVANGLDYAHQRQVIHRDIKPSNIMISRDDRVVLTDFGLALDMNTGSMGQIFGTPHYVAPEQVRRSSDANPQSDIYSFGIVLYEMLTGTLPFDDPSATALAMQHLTEEPPSPRYMNPQLNPSTEKVLLKALAKEPSERYASTTAFIDALETALQDTSTDPATSPAIMPPAAISKRNHQQTHISHMSLADMLALELDEKSSMSVPQAVGVAHKMASPPKPMPVPEQKSNNQMLYIGGAIGAVLIIVILIAVFAFGGNNTVEETSALDLAATSEALALAETQQALALAPADVATATEAPVTIASAIPTATEVEFTIIPTDDIAATAAIIEVTNAVIATSNAQLEATLTQGAQQAQFNQQATQTQQAAIPTVIFPSGRLLELSYNTAGFYVRNSSSSRIRVSRLAFLAIDANGTALSQPFNGSDWARNYSFIDADGRCNAIELLNQSGWSRPNNCVSASGFDFNSLLTFPENDSRIFWKGINGAVQFAVFWDNAEIARCTIASGYCQVRVGE
ncbi:MAG: protein kinase [Phototrophicaceae bacterium]